MVPVHTLARIATRDVEIEGRRARAGDRLFTWIASANRDESVFPDPDRFDIHRSPNPHIAFGFGIHFCLGAPLARLEGRVALDVLLRRLREIRHDERNPRGIRAKRVPVGCCTTAASRRGQAV